MIRKPVIQRIMSRAFLYRRGARDLAWGPRWRSRILPSCLSARRGYMQVGPAHHIHAATRASPLPASRLGRDHGATAHLCGPCRGYSCQAEHGPGLGLATRALLVRGPTPAEPCYRPSKTDSLDLDSPPSSAGATACRIHRHVQGVGSCRLALRVSTVTTTSLPVLHCHTFGQYASWTGGQICIWRVFGAPVCGGWGRCCC